MTERNPASPEAVQSFKDVCFISGSLLIVFVASLFIFSCASFLLRFPATVPIFYLSILATVFLWLFLALKYFNKKVLVYVFIIVSGTFMISALSSFFLDVSYDGQYYHQETVIQLAKGWNPFFEELAPANPAENRIFRWVKHYVRAAEIAESCLYKATHRIESAKTINILLIFASVYLAACCLCTLKKMTPKRAVLLAFAAAFNPVVVCTSLSFYVDGQLGSVALCLACLFCLFYLRPTGYLSIVIISASIYFMNIKFTAVVYFIVLAMGFLIISILNKKTAIFKKSLLVFTVSFLLGVFVFGYNPYVTNTRDHGHPFFPAMGPGTVDISRNNRFQGADSMTRVERFWISMFARSTITPRRDIKMKIPLTLFKDEILAFGYPEVKTGGFGQFFSGILLLSSALLVLSFVRFKENRIFYVTILFFLLSVFINPECWLARYVPQFWLIPLLMIIFPDFGPSGVLAKRLAAVATLLIFLNISLVGAYYLFRQTRSTQKVRHELKDLSQRKMPLNVDFLHFRSNRVRLDEYGLRYTEVSETPGAFSHLYLSRTMVKNE